MNQRFLIIILSVVLITSLCAAPSLSATLSFGPLVESDAEILMIRNQSVSLEKVSVINELLQNDEAFSSTYAGRYLDNEGNLVILVTKPQEVVTTKALSNVRWEQVDYSYDYLEKIASILRDAMEENTHITRVGVREKQNRVVVGVSAIEDEVLEKIKKLVDSPAIEFEEAGPMQFTVLMGDRLVTSLGEKVTSGFRAQRQDGLGTWKNGIVTAGHIFAPNNSNLTYNGEVIGWRTPGQQCSGTVDATFYQVNSPFSPTKTFRQGPQYNIIEQAPYTVGMYMEIFGDVSDRQSGYVISTSESIQLEWPNGRTAILHDQVISDYKAIPGDSGAAVTWIKPNGLHWDRNVTGIQSGALLVDGAWVPGVSRTSHSKLNNIMPALSLRGY